MFATTTNNKTKTHGESQSKRADAATGGKAASASNSVWQSLALRPAAIQPKLNVSQPGDPHEQEADHIADQIMQTSAAPPDSHALHISPTTHQPAQRKCDDCEDEDRQLRRKEQQASLSSFDGAPPEVRETLSSPGKALDDSTSTFFEQRFGKDMSRVRVHTDPVAGRSAEAVRARAYTAGSHIVFGSNQYAPHSTEGRRLLAHEMTHVLQQEGGAPTLQRESKQEQEDPPKMTLSGDSERKSKPGGVAIKNGTLEWTLKFRGKDNEAVTDKEGSTSIFLGADVDFNASFTPSKGATTCPTITFTQTVRPTISGSWDTGPLLYTRSPATGASVDVIYGPSQPETDPFYGASPRSRGAGFEATTTRSITGTHAGASGQATLKDAPFQRRLPKGTTATRLFESAVICIETAETFGSISWGYTKTSDGVVTLLGGTENDVQASSASAAFETTRQAFYTGFFQLSLGNFGVGSHTLTSDHKSKLDSIDTKDITRMILVGANDNSGGSEAKPELSLKRAEAGRNYLVNSRGVSASAIKVEGHGVEARVPNPPGQEVPANRRLDVHIQRGAETMKPAQKALGSATERQRIKKQNPRLTVDDAVKTIIRLDATSGRVSTSEWAELLDMLNALDDWRRVDPTVPDLRQIYSAELKRLKSRSDVGTPPAREPFPSTGPISPEVDEALREYEESKRRLQELKRRREMEELLLKEEYEVE